MENGRNGQAAQAEEKPEKRMEAMPAEQAEKPEAEKKPGYPMHKRRYTPLYTIIVFLYGILVKLLFFMKIEGRENVPKDRNCILMGNHQCLLDPVTLALCVPDREIHFMGKKELFENKALGWIFRQVHGFRWTGQHGYGRDPHGDGRAQRGRNAGHFSGRNAQQDRPYAAAFGRRFAAGAQERMRRGADLHRGQLQAVSSDDRSRGQTGGDDRSARRPHEQGNLRRTDAPHGSRICSAQRRKIAARLPKHNRFWRKKARRWRNFLKKFENSARFGRKTEKDLE